jgi:hypothetical protein
MAGNPMRKAVGRRGKKGKEEQEGRGTKEEL